jgi:protein-tyrosine phosphatase
MTSVLFVCLGNICRSPTAEAVFRARASRSDLEIDSAGTGAWHAGNPPDSRSRAEGERRGYSFAGQAARQVKVRDFYDFDFILAMDASNLSDLKAMRPENATAQISLFLPDGSDVPDPYYGGPKGFSRVVDLIEDASDFWLSQMNAR